MDNYYISNTVTLYNQERILCRKFAEGEIDYDNLVGKVVSFKGIDYKIIAIDIKSKTGFSALVERCI